MDYDIFVFCGGKCGGTTLSNTLTKHGYKTLHMHDPTVVGMYNHNIILPSNIFNIIDNSSIYHKVYIIDSYRNPLERKMSAFFQKPPSVLKKYEELSEDELYNLFNTTNTFINSEYYHPLNTLLKHYEIDPFSTFDFDKRYNMIEKDNKVFIKLRFEDILQWGEILCEILGKEIIIDPCNFTTNNLYSKFKANYKANKNFLNLMLKDKEFKIYNTIEEQERYKNKWN